MKALQQAVDAKRKEFETAERTFNIKKDKFDTMNEDKKRQDKETADKEAAEKKAEYDTRRTAFDEKRNAYFTAKKGSEDQEALITAAQAKIDALPEGDEKESWKTKKSDATTKKGEFDTELAAGS